MLVQEMKNRGYNHYTPLPAELATGNEIQDQFVNSYDEQIKILQNKGCGCKV